MPEDIICPKCGANLTKLVKWSKLYSKPPIVYAEGVTWQFKCPKCGKLLEDTYTHSGVWDPEKDEYIWEP